MQKLEIHSKIVNRQKIIETETENIEKSKQKIKDAKKDIADFNKILEAKTTQRACNLCKHSFIAAAKKNGLTLDDILTVIEKNNIIETDLLKKAVTKKNKAVDIATETEEK